MSVPATEIEKKVADFRGVDKQPVNQGRVSGRVVSVRRVQGANGAFFVTLLTPPAPDAYSSPQTVELNSSRRLADKGEDVMVPVQIGGFRRTYRATDKDTGEQTNVMTADVRLTVIE